MLHALDSIYGLLVVDFISNYSRSQSMPSVFTAQNVGDRAKGCGQGICRDFPTHFIRTRLSFHFPPSTSTLRISYSSTLVMSYSTETYRILALYTFILFLSAALLYTLAYLIKRHTIV